MCMAISGQDVLDYIFSSDSSRRQVTYDEIETFTDSLMQNVRKNRFDDPYYETIYFEPLREPSERRYDGILVKRRDGIHLFGSIKGDARGSIESRYEDPKITHALREALKAVMA